MYNLKSPGLIACFVVGASALLIASCKPAEETKPTPTAPAATNPPPVASVVVETNAPVSTNAPVLISAAKARDYIGKEATVRGQVTDVHITQKGDVFLNFGGKYPNSVFTAACFQGAIPADQLRVLKGQTISVTGKIKEYNGQVEIVLSSMDQISK